MDQPQVLNLVRLREVTNRDEPLIAELLEMSARLNDPLLEDLKAAVRAARWDVVTSLAHKLKGAFVTIGADELGTLCGEFEHGLEQAAPAQREAALSALGAANERLRFVAGTYARSGRARAS